MKTTPFQLALKNEIQRLERLSSSYTAGTYSLVLFKQSKPVKGKHFLLQFLQALSF